MRQKEWDQINADTFLEAWRYELSDIRHANTWYIYLGMFGMSESVQQLERLHESLPENMRLLRQDFIVLKKYWQHHFSNKEKEYREKVIKNVLLAMTWGDGESYVTGSSYYATRIRRRNTYKLPPHFLEDAGAHLSLPVKPSAQEIGNHFFALLFGVKVRVEFRLKQDGSYILVVVIFQEVQLTEKITHQIIDVLPQYCLINYGMASMSTKTGLYFNLGYEFDAKDVANDIKSVSGDRSYCPSIIFLATQKFLVSAADLLRKNGIPVEGNLITANIEY
jgi:hypothetical protein